MARRVCPVCEGRPPCPPDEAAWHRVYEALRHAEQERDVALARVAEYEARDQFSLFRQVEDVATDAV